MIDHQPNAFDSGHDTRRELFLADIGRDPGEGDRSTIDEHPDAADVHVLRVQKRLVDRYLQLGVDEAAREIAPR